MGSHTMGPGTVLGGRYRLDDLLTDHDGARFWRATDLVLSRSVAVHALASSDPRADDVLDAARESATVTDAHFLRVLDCADDGELTWVINEWGSGLSLDLILERGILPPTRAAALAREVAEAIAAAHAADVHHGRLNPESVLVTDSGAVKVIGFVTHRAFEGADRNPAPYGDPDPREADVIDLAGILYAALTGKWAGVSASVVPPAPREAGRPLRPRQVRAGIPRTLDQICDRVLNKEASRHVLPIESAHEIAAALSDFVGDPGALAPLDVRGLYDEPTVALPRRAGDDGHGPRQPAPGAGPTPAQDPEATVAAAPPVAEPTQRIEPPADPPPPFEQPAERPLFADHERRVPRDAPVLPPYPPPSSGSSSDTSGPASSSGPLTGTGTGTGAHPAYWPFVDDADDGAAVGAFSGREGRGWLRLAGIIALVLLLAVAMFVAFNMGRGDDETPKDNASQAPPATTVGQPVRIIGASDFDPEGDPSSENPDEVPLAIDGKPQTAWTTKTYRGNPALGGLKSGVGLLLDLGADQDVGSVKVTLGGGPTQLELYASGTGVSQPPSDIGDVEQVVGSTTANGSVVLRPKQPLKTRFLVVWLTRLPAVDGGYRGEIAEVSVHS